MDILKFTKEAAGLVAKRAIAKAQLTDNRVVDWNKLVDLALANPTATIAVGIFEDWFSTAAPVVRDGIPVVLHIATVASEFGTPAIQINGGEVTPCFVFCDDDIVNEWPIECLERIVQ